MLKIPVTSKDHVQGKAQAPVLLVEYGDYECPYCGQAYPIVKQVQRHFGEKLGFVFRNFPLNEMHPHAEIAAEAAEFAADHEQFWKMHDELFENQRSLGPEMLYSLVEALELPAEDLRTALQERKYRPRVREDFAGGVRSGVNGTPTFFINGKRHDGTFEFRDLVTALESEVVSATGQR
jgi:protein-disulfide isomerase